MRSIYFGWFIVVAAMLIYSLLLGTTFMAYGLFVVPVSAAFDLSRADMNTGLILLNIGNAILAPVIGRLLDRISARRIMFACSLLLAASLILLGLSHSLWLNAAVMALPVAAGILGGGTITVSILIARWFSVYRGRAMALSAIGMSLGGIIVAPIIGWMIETQGWRTALILTGAAVGLLMLLLTYVVRERPGPDDVEAPGVAAAQTAAEQDALPAEKPLPAMTILRTPLFWVLSLGVALGIGVTMALMVSLVPLAIDSGLSTMQSASLISVIGIAGVGSMLVLAAVADRIERSLLLAGLIFLGLAPSAILLFTPTYPVLLAAAVIIGLTTATVAPINFALLADRFGLAAFGTVRGLMVPVGSIVGALTIRFIGEVHDRTGNYDAGFWAFIVIDVIAAMLVLASRYMKVPDPA